MQKSIQQMQIEEKLATLRKEFVLRKNVSKRKIMELQARSLINAWEGITGRTYQRPATI